MKTQLLTALLLSLSFSASVAAQTDSLTTADTIIVTAEREGSWLNLQEKWQHLAHIGKMAWPANWFKDKHRGEADSCLVLNESTTATANEALPRFYNTLALKLSQSKVSHSLRISWDKKQKPQQLVIFNLAGEKMLEFKLAYAGLGELEVPVQQLLPGTYLVQVSAGSENATLAFEKK